MTTQTAPAAAPAAPVDTDPQFVVRFPDNYLVVQSAKDVARMLMHAAHGHDADEFFVYTWSATAGTFAPVKVEQKQSPFDGDDYADVSVRLVAEDGTVLATAGYRIDGRG